MRKGSKVTATIVTRTNTGYVSGDKEEIILTGKRTGVLADGTKVEFTAWGWTREKDDLTCRAIESHIVKDCKACKGEWGGICPRQIGL
jgi:hypothetical protein